MNEVQELLRYFASQYKFKTGHGYVVSWARHGAQAKKMLAEHSLTTLRKVVRVYLYDFNDSFYERKGKPFDLLSVALPELLRKVRDEEQRKQRPSGRDDYQRVLEAREAARRTQPEVVQGVQEEEAAGTPDGDTDS